MQFVHRFKTDSGGTSPGMTEGVPTGQAPPTRRKPSRTPPPAAARTPPRATGNARSSPASRCRSWRSSRARGIAAACGRCRPRAPRALPARRARSPRGPGCGRGEGKANLVVEPVVVGHHVGQPGPDQPGARCRRCSRRVTSCRPCCTQRCTWLGRERWQGALRATTNLRRLYTTPSRGPR